MLTTFLLNRNNLLSNFTAKSNASSVRTNRYITQQDAIADNFQKQLNTNIQNFLLAVPKKENFTLVVPIKNALWQLWNAAWNLGMQHAAAEVPAKFSSNDLVTFAKKKEDSEAEKLIRDIRRIDDNQARINRDYKREDGTYRANRILKAGDRQGKYTDEDRAKAIEAMQQTEQQLAAERKAKLDRLAQIGDGSRPKAKATKESRRGSSKRKPKPDAVYDEATVQSTAYKRTQEQRLEQQKVAPLEQSEFGQIYLKERLNNLASNVDKQLTPYYKQQLQDIVPRYFKSDAVTKDAGLIQKVRKMYVDERVANLKYDQQQTTLKNLINRTRDNERAKLNNIVSDLRSAQATLNSNSSRLTVQERFALINRIEQLKKDEAAINRGIDKQTVLVSLTANDADSMGLAPGTYTLKQLNQQQQKIRQEKDTIDANYYNTRRIAATELGHAYNLGRIDYLQKNKIKFVRWNTSVEHQRRTASNSTTRGYKSIAKKNSLTYTPNGSVCPVCQERSQRNSGFGEGVYELSRLLKNPQLMPVLHPFCGCYLEPMDEKDVKKPLVVKVASLFSENVAKWAGAGLLGTTLMYAMYLRTRGTTGGVTTTVFSPPVSPLTRAVAATLTQGTIDEVTEVAENVAANRTIIDSEPITRVAEPTIRLPMISLSPPAPIDISGSTDSINNALSTPYPGTNNEYRTVANNEATRSRNIARQANSISPDYNAAVNQGLQQLRARAEQYVGYTKSTSSTIKTQVLNSYRRDVRGLNQAINELEDGNGILYSQMLNIQQIIREGEQNIGEIVEDKVGAFASTDIGRSLYSELAELDNSLRNRMELLQPGGYHDELVNIRERILQNTDLSEDYLSRAAKQIRSSFGRIRNKPLTEFSTELDNLADEIRLARRIDPNRYRQISNDLETLETLLNDRLALISKSIIDVDIERYLVANRTQDNVLMAMTVLAYRKEVRLLKNRIYLMSNSLISKLE